MDTKRKRQEAQQILANPVWDELIEDVRARYYSQWRSSLTTEAREAMHLRLSVLDDLITELRDTATET